MKGQIEIYLVSILSCILQVYHPHDVTKSDTPHKKFEWNFIPLVSRK